MNLSSLRVLRLLRLLRITRLVRLLRVIEDLRTIVSSVVCSLRPLFWTLTLLFLMVYMLSVLITQIVTTSLVANDAAVRIRYGNLVKTLLTLYLSISDGIEWEHALNPLIDVSPLLGFLFCSFMAFALFALMNVITGVVVERALTVGQNDKEEFVANHLFSVLYNDRMNDGITFDHFAQMLNSVELREYFMDIGVNVQDVSALFDLLDEDGSGSVDPVEFLAGCLRLRGGAKALELSIFSRETARQFAWIRESMIALGQQVSTNDLPRKSTAESRCVRGRGMLGPGKMG